ncbi:NUDIX domain-containing protein [Salana multivorans]
MEDDGAEVLLLRQYRVPVGGYLWEIPAGLLDGGDDETLLAAAQRELAEEADLVAARWEVLVDFATTPGSNSEVIRIFLAREVSPAPKSSFVREGEESEIRLEWVPLAEAARAVLAGRMHSPSGCLGVLAATLAEQAGFTALRDVSTPFLLRPGLTPA